MRTSGIKVGLGGRSLGFGYDPAGETRIELESNPSPDEPAFLQLQSAP
jgi:hypothetical protein